MQRAHSSSAIACLLAEKRWNRFCIKPWTNAAGRTTFCSTVDLLWNLRKTSTSMSAIRFLPTLQTTERRFFFRQEGTIKYCAWTDNNVTTIICMTKSDAVPYGQRRLCKVMQIMTHKGKSTHNVGARFVISNTGQYHEIKMHEALLEPFNTRWHPRKTEPEDPICRL